MGNDIDLVFRDFKEEDMPFIFSTWLKSYKNESSFAQRIRNDTFFSWHHLIIENILKKPTTSITIAHVKDDPDVILGYMIGERPATIHYAFVKEPFRGFGVATQLFERTKISIDNCEFTHWTYPMDSIILKYSKLNYNPYAI